MFKRLFLSLDFFPRNLRRFLLFSVCLSFAAFQTQISVIKDVEMTRESIKEMENNNPDKKVFSKEIEPLVAALNSGNLWYKNFAAAKLDGTIRLLKNNLEKVTSDEGKAIVEKIRKILQENAPFYKGLKLNFARDKSSLIENIKKKLQGDNNVDFGNLVSDWEGLFASMSKSELLAFAGINPEQQPEMQNEHSQRQPAPGVEDDEGWELVDAPKKAADAGGSSTDPAPVPQEHAQQRASISVEELHSLFDKMLDKLSSMDARYLDQKLIKTPNLRVRSYAISFLRPDLFFCNYTLPKLLFNPFMPQNLQQKGLGVYRKLIAKMIENNKILTQNRRSFIFPDAVLTKDGRFAWQMISSQKLDEKVQLVLTSDDSKTEPIADVPNAPKYKIDESILSSYKQIIDDINTGKILDDVKFTNPIHQLCKFFYRAFSYAQFWFHNSNDNYRFLSALAMGPIYIPLKLFKIFILNPLWALESLFLNVFTNVFFVFISPIWGFQGILSLIHYIFSQI